jgi:hypothetical protein
MKDPFCISMGIHEDLEHSRPSRTISNLGIYPRHRRQRICRNVEPFVDLEGYPEDAQEGEGHTDDPRPIVAKADEVLYCIRLIRCTRVQAIDGNFLPRKFPT